MTRHITTHRLKFDRLRPAPSRYCGPATLMSCDRIGDRDWLMRHRCELFRSAVSAHARQFNADAVRKRETSAKRFPEIKHA